MNLKNLYKFLYYDYIKQTEKSNMLSTRSLNNLLSERIILNIPTMVTRIGMTECSVIKIFDCNIKSKKEKMCSQLCNWSGFFPDDEMLVDRFVSTYKKSFFDIDILAIQEQPYENVIINSYCKNSIKLSNLIDLEPWYFTENPWSKALEGKKVLVISPFAEDIVNQYKKRKSLFTNSDILPDFDLKVLQAVQTLAGIKDERFSDWFEALEWMHKQTKYIDFDVAIIGCGAYGLPLASKLKNDGKVSIHLGGATQLLFGIKGKRWMGESYHYINKYFNDEWIFPSEYDSRFKSVENGCYWK